MKPSRDFGLDLNLGVHTYIYSSKDSVLCYSRQQNNHISFSMARATDTVSEYTQRWYEIGSKPSNCLKTTDIASEQPVDRPGND